MSDNEPDLSTRAEEGFISRWSRRKHADNADPVEDSRDVEIPVDAEAAEEADLPDDSDMPPIESLDEDSDYSGFMSPKVSEGLRILALRKLFHGSAFNIRDGLDDYDDDFTQFAKLGKVVTAEMRHQMERMKEAMDNDDAEQGELDEEIDVAVLEAETETGERVVREERGDVLINQDEDVEDELSDEN